MVLDLKEVRVGEYRRALLLIFGAVALLLLIAVSNVAGSCSCSLRRRSVEFAIRSAIGAAEGDPRIIIESIRQLVRSLDAACPVFGVRRVDEIIGALASSSSTRHC